MAACNSIACDYCPKPGNCCQYFALSVPDLKDPSRTALEQLCRLATIVTLDCQGRVMTGVPFMPFGIMPNSTYNDQPEWRYWCPNLSLEGRCMDYENRPHTCSDFLPGSDRICVLHKKGHIE